MFILAVVFFRPSVAEVLSWAESLEALLSNQCKPHPFPLVSLPLNIGSTVSLLSCHWLDGVAVFRHFLRSEFSEENLDFWLAVERLKQTRHLSKMASRAEKIYAEFISTSAVRQVHVCLSAL